MSFIWNAQSILGTATIFADLGTAARAASVVYDGPALGRTEAVVHDQGRGPGAIADSGRSTHHASTPPAILRLLCTRPFPTRDFHTELFL